MKSKKTKIVGIEEKVKEAIENGEHIKLIDTACLLLWGERSNESIQNHYMDKYLEKYHLSKPADECAKYALTETLKWIVKE